MLDADILHSTFPGAPRDIAKAAVPDGAELLNRLMGAVPETGDGRTGRPKNNKPQLHLNPNDAEATNIVFKHGDENHWAAGSVLQILGADSRWRSVVLLHDLKVAPLSEDEEGE